jgi:hypothetical protein
VPKTTNPERWAEIRKHLGTDQFRLLWIKPEENVLLGWWKICDYLGVKDRKTLQIWVDEWALPAIKRPDGVWMTTMTSIDQWIMLASQTQYENRTKNGETTGQRRALKAQLKASTKMDRGRTEEPAEPL